LRRRKRGLEIALVVARYALAAVLGGAIVWYCGRDAPTATVDPLQSTVRDYAWRAQPAPAFPFPPYARFLEGVQIVLDPGHGGRADRKGWKRGPTGLREAEVNLRVAQFLRDFLQAAGADVVLTRSADVYLDPDDSLDLRRRIEIANQRQADLFLSIHHNAGASADANYTSVFYHATPDYSPPSLDAARHLLEGLNDALRLEQHLGCALVSDYAVLPGRGFAVLRQAEVPAVLTEASFHSNPDEENRLRDALYNRREAYGLFLGLARWAQAGLPRVALVEPAREGTSKDRSILVTLDDGLSRRGGLGAALPQIQTETLTVTLDGDPVPYSLELDAGRLRIRGGRQAIKHEARLYVDFANVFGQHVLHPWIDLRAAGHGSP
jgi:N-acetylmuramoyl-L-alanine amidase